MIDGQQLLAALQPMRKQLEDDLRERSAAVPELGQRLREEWQTARQRERTAQTYESWRDDTLAQAAVMWLLASVFVRFLEDNALVDPPRLAGPGLRLQLARDQRTLYFQAHPHNSDRDYLYSVFEAVAALPAAAPLFDHRQNPIWSIGISGDAATQLIDFWQHIDPTTGALVHDFTDPEWRTRFLGDLYQDLSESARKKYALLQTPDFVLQFILDRTLTPAIAEFGFREVRLIDPACGSGHFLMAAFERLFRQWAQHEPGRNTRELVQRALAQVTGVDLNPFAIAIARFRLLLTALRASNITRLADAPAFTMELAAGDALLHGPRPGDQGRRQMYLDPSTDPLAHVYATEDAEDLKRILGRRYHVVLGNPPYITPKDAAINKAYRDRFGSCHRQYSLGVPFTERLFDLAIEPAPGEVSLAGYVGMITANSFMKREFGKKLIEEYIPRWDLTHVIDTSGAYIPGHGTPTVILFGRHSSPASPTVRAVFGIKGEPTTPDDPAQGRVWRAIVEQTDRPGSSSDFISVSDADRATFQKHPWSIGGGGAAELKAAIEVRASHVLQDCVEEIGRTTHTGEDDAFYLPFHSVATRGFAGWVVPLVVGEDVRDYSIRPQLAALFPYDLNSGAPVALEGRSVLEHFWKLRTNLRNRLDFDQRPEERGLRWFDHSMFFPARYRTTLSIAFPFVATHGHFVLDRGGKVFKQTAPVVKLKAGATEEDHLALLGLLNSSTACFWMKQTFFDRGNGGIGGGIANEEWERFFEHDATKLARLPVPPTLPLLGAQCTRDAQALIELAPNKVLERGVRSAADLGNEMKRAHSDHDAGLQELISLQEELDWETYGCFGLDGTSVLSETAPRLRLGERAFEIVMARKMAIGELKTAWFERHGSTPIGEVPAHWPQAYRQVVQRRIDLIESNPDIALIEQPEYKRRWNVEPWDARVERALRGWLLDRLESRSYWCDVALTSIAWLADRARQDTEFMVVATLYRRQDDFDVSALVVELVESAAVPFLPVLRYKTSGLRKREQWERTWDLQRREDTKEDVGEIPVPPKYTSADFANSTFWQLRGKLDVPKERFISYPFCQRDADPTPVVAWAGWDQLQQAKALATYYVQMKESEGWSKERLTPLLAGLLELLPWLVQWHNEIDPEYGQRMGEFYEGFLDEEARALGLTRDAIRSWTPPAAVSRRRGRPTQQTDD
jgi:hypothetical protein